MTTDFDPLDFSDCMDTDMPIPDFTGSSDEDDGYEIFILEIFVAFKGCFCCFFLNNASAYRDTHE